MEIFLRSKKYSQKSLTSWMQFSLSQSKVNFYKFSSENYSPSTEITRLILIVPRHSRLLIVLLLWTSWTDLVFYYFWCIWIILEDRCKKNGSRVDPISASLHEAGFCPHKWFLKRVEKCRLLFRFHQCTDSLRQILFVFLSTPVWARHLSFFSL